MRLVVDASALVAEVLRGRGRELLTHPTLDLALADETWGETEHELRNRVALLADCGIFTPLRASQILDEALTTIAARVTLVSPDADRMEEARRRIPRDPHDAPVVALALAPVHHGYCLVAGPVDRSCRWMEREAGRHRPPASQMRCASRVAPPGEGRSVPPPLPETPSSRSSVSSASARSVRSISFFAPSRWKIARAS